MQVVILMPAITLFKYERGPLINPRCVVMVSLIGAEKSINKWKLIKKELAQGSGEEHMRHVKGKTDEAKMASCKDEHFPKDPVVIG